MLRFYWELSLKAGLLMAFSSASIFTWWCARRARRWRRVTTVTGLFEFYRSLLYRYAPLLWERLRWRRRWASRARLHRCLPSRQSAAMTFSKRMIVECFSLRCGRGHKRRLVSMPPSWGLMLWITFAGSAILPFSFDIDICLRHIRTSSQCHFATAACHAMHTPKIISRMTLFYYRRKYQPVLPYWFFIFRFSPEFQDRYYMWIDILFYRREKELPIYFTSLGLIFSVAILLPSMILAREIAATAGLWYFDEYFRHFYIFLYDAKWE